MTREAFTWDGIEHWTGVDLMETVSLLSDEDEATDFMNAYVEAWGGNREHAEHNIIYLCAMIEDGGDQLELFGIDADLSKPIAPMQWWPNSSLGVKS